MSDETKVDVNTFGNGKIVDKIRKMLRLARDAGATEAEAALAMAKAQQMMLQYNIDNVEEVTEQAAVKGDWHNFEVDKTWQRMLTQAIAEMFNCRVVWAGNNGSVQFVGKPSNVLVAIETLQWVNDQMQDLYKAARRADRVRFGSFTKAQSKEYRLTFKEGCCRRIRQRVAEITAHERSKMPTGTALIVIDQALAAADELLKGVKKARARTMHLGLGTTAGRMAGDQIKLQQTFKK